MENSTKITSGFLVFDPLVYYKLYNTCAQLTTDQFLLSGTSLDLLKMYYVWDLLYQRRFKVTFFFPLLHLVPYITLFWHLYAGLLSEMIDKITQWFWFFFHQCRISIFFGSILKYVNVVYLLHAFGLWDHNVILRFWGYYNMIFFCLEL